MYALALLPLAVGLIACKNPSPTPQKPEVSIEPEDPSVPEGSSTSFQGSVTWSNSIQIINGRWQVLSQGEVFTEEAATFSNNSSSFIYAAGTPGETQELNLQVTVEDGDGITASGEDVTNIYIDQAPTVFSISAPSDGQMFHPDETVDFLGKVSDLEGALTSSGVRWVLNGDDTSFVAVLDAFGNVSGGGTSLAIDDYALILCVSDSINPEVCSSEVNFSVEEECNDTDKDGVSDCEEDCNNEDNTIYPGAEELCDGKDNNCDGTIPSDEFDSDGDGFKVCEGDCDDGNETITPAALDHCDGIDNDCDDEIDEGWHLTFGGSGTDGIRSLQLDDDLNYYLAGYTSSWGAGSSDAWLFSVAQDGTQTPADGYTYGDGSIDMAYAQSFISSDSIYLAGTYTSDLWLGEADSAGGMDEIFSINGEGLLDTAYALAVNPSGEVMTTGIMYFSDTVQDAFAIKTSASHTEECRFLLNQDGIDNVYAVQSADDIGYDFAFAGASQYCATSPPGYGSLDGWIFFLDENCNWVNEYCLGSTSDDALFSMYVADDGIIGVGYTTSDTGDLNAWAVKINTSGADVWDNLSYGDDESTPAIFYSIQPLGDESGYVLAGYKTAADGDTNAWVVIIDNDGNKTDEFVFEEDSASADDVFYAALEYEEGEIVAAGTTESFGAGGQDGLLAGFCR